MQSGVLQCAYFRCFAHRQAGGGVTRGEGGKGHGKGGVNISEQGEWEEGEGMV
jgi:hypothetical protein